MLAGKSILVLGGGVIARGVIALLAESRANIMIGDVRIDEAHAIADAAIAVGAEAAPIHVDMGDAFSIQQAIKQIMDRFGRLDGLFLNAADLNAAMEDMDLLTIDPAVWERSLKINLTGYFHAVRAALPMMLRSGGGSIVCTASDDAFLGAPVRVAYATSKTAILALSRHIAACWGKEGIRCNAICPGLVPHTNLAGAFGKEVKDFQNEFLTNMASPRLGNPLDIGAMVRLLLSDEGEWVNGQALSIDGGLVMR